MEIELSPPNTNLADAVRTARISAGVTQEKLAQKANLSVRAIRLIERGECDPRDGTIKSICDALEIPSIVLHCMAASDDDRKKIAKLLDVYHTHRSL